LNVVWGCGAALAGLRSEGRGAVRAGPDDASNAMWAGPIRPPGCC